MRKRTFDVSEIAERLGVARTTVYRMLEAGEIPALRAGRRYVITSADLKQWMGADRFEAVFAPGETGHHTAGG